MVLWSWYLIKSTATALRNLSLPAQFEKIYPVFLKEIGELTLKMSICAEFSGT